MTFRYEAPDGTAYAVEEDSASKRCDAEDGSYHYTFDKRTGHFSRWGQRREDDPPWCPIGPEILDLEISANGCQGRCPFCYKDNTDAPPENMSFDTFKAIFDRMPKVLTQIAFGITGPNANPDFFRMMEYARSNGVVPNFTISGSDPVPDRVARLAGAFAVSVHAGNRETAYDTVRELSEKGMTQVNVHLVASKETVPLVRQVLCDRISDKRLKKMNAIVLLSVKPKGRAKGRFSPMPTVTFGAFVATCLISGIKFGFDSCSAPRFEEAIESTPPSVRKSLREMSESCESGLFSAYVNRKGEFFPCSFCEGEEGWEEGIPVPQATSFRDVWTHPKTASWRQGLLESSRDGCRHCPLRFG